MLDAKEIDLAIAELEYKESSYPNYTKLAALYTIRDRMTQPSYEQDYSRAAAPADYAEPVTYGDSDFLRAIVGKDTAAVWTVVDELMDTLKVVNQRAYNSVMRKIQNI